jgi:hypothetical protein
MHFETGALMFVDILTLVLKWAGSRGLVEVRVGRKVQITCRELFWWALHPNTPKHNASQQIQTQSEILPL